MAIGFDAWLGHIRREYLESFIPEGGGAVRFLVAEHDAVPALGGRLAAAAATAGLAGISLDLGVVKLHMLHHAFFAIARAIDWDQLIQARLESLVEQAGYRWPEPGQSASFAQLAHANGIAPMLLRNSLQQQITRAVWNDAGLALDFRNAMIALLDARLSDEDTGLRQGVLDWLRGDLRALAAVRGARIGARIGRQNARAMLVSLCHWLRGCRHPGLLLLLDIRRLLRDRREITDGAFYSPAAVMDCYEVLRQLIDDAEHMEGLFVVVMADARLIDDEAPKRALSQYTALKMRVWDDVRPLGQDNPLAPLVVVAA